MLRESRTNGHPGVWILGGFLCPQIRSPLTYLSPPSQGSEKLSGPIPPRLCWSFRPPGCYRNPRRGSAPPTPPASPRTSSRDGSDNPVPLDPAAWTPAWTPACQPACSAGLGPRPHSPDARLVCYAFSSGVSGLGSPSQGAQTTAAPEPSIPTPPSPGSLPDSPCAHPSRTRTGTAGSPPGGLSGPATPVRAMGMDVSLRWSLEKRSGKMSRPGRRRRPWPHCVRKFSRSHRPDRGGAASPGLTERKGSPQELAEDRLDERSFSSVPALASVSKCGGPAGQHVLQTSV